MNTNQFTQKTMEALQNAQSLAIEHQNQALEPEHLLAALASQENGFIPQLLKRMGVEPSAFAVAAQEKVEQLPPQIVNGKPVPQGTVNNYQFVSAEGQWKISLTKGFIALSTYGYTRWEEFAQRLDRILAVFIETYHPSWFTRVGLRYVNAFRRAPLGLEDCLWKELITPGFLGLMGDEDAQEQAFMKNELTATVQMPGGAKANVKSGPGLLRKVNNRTRETTEERVFMLDLDLYMDSKIELNHTAPALNIVHDNAGSLFRAAITDTLADAMEPQKA